MIIALPVLLQLLPIAAGWDPSSGSLPDAPDCECKESWMNSARKCNPDDPASGGGGAKQMLGCPTLELLSECSDSPTQSWCETKNPICKQQATLDMYNESWTFCDPITQKSELPICTCKKKWTVDTEECSLPLSGCTEAYVTNHCFPNRENQSWCETDQEHCLQQEDEIIDGKIFDAMVGQGWAYCDISTATTTLPSCTCESQWDDTCKDDVKIFSNCPSFDSLKKCGSATTAYSASSWCKTTRARCLEQTHHGYNPASDMRNRSWVNCDSKTGKAEWPLCECESVWTNTKDRCEDHPLQLKGCPSDSELLKCDEGDRNSWCQTTYETCRIQNSESKGKGWAYCDQGTQKPVVGECQCQESWKLGIGECKNKGKAMRGCPEIADMKECEKVLPSSWCPTTDLTCGGQINENKNKGWVYCDPSTQRPLEDNTKTTAASVAIQVGITLGCALVVVGLFFLYRRFVNRTKKTLKGYMHDVVTEKLVADAMVEMNDEDEEYE